MKIATVQTSVYTAFFGAALFIPKLAEDIGASKFQIGLIVAMYGFMLFLSSIVFGRLADVHGRKKIILIGLVTSGISCTFQIFADNVLTLTIARATFGFSAGIFPAALVAYAYESKRKLGKFLSYGSLGFGVGCIIACIVSTYGGYDLVFLVSSLILFIAFFVAIFLPPIKEIRHRVPILPVKIIKKSYAAYIAVLLRHIGATSIWVLFPNFLTLLGKNTCWEKNIDFWIGVIYLINGFGQFIIMQFLDRFSSWYLIILGTSMSSLAFLCFAICTDLWQIIVLQLLLACAFSCLYVGSFKYIMERNVEHATSAGWLNSTFSLSNIIGPIIGGTIANIFASIYTDMFGYRITMVFGGGLAFGGMLMFYYTHRQ
jgi:DHA1 family quinolone resistance protein-like MFS transporter